MDRSYSRELLRVQRRHRLSSAFHRPYLFHRLRIVSASAACDIPDGLLAKVSGTERILARLEDDEVGELARSERPYRGVKPERFRGVRGGSSQNLHQHRQPSLEG